MKDREEQGVKLHPSPPVVTSQLKTQTRYQQFFFAFVLLLKKKNLLNQEITSDSVYILSCYKC